MKLQDNLLNIQIATPCPARWEDMQGDDRARFCGQCRKHVYDLSALGAAAAADLLREKEGNLCAQFYRRADGTILYAEDCPVGLAARRWRRVKHLAGAAASFVLMMGGMNKAQAGDTTNSRPEGGMIRGRVCVSPTPTPTPTPNATATPGPKAK